MNLKKSLIVFAVVGLTSLNIAAQSVEPACYVMEGVYVASHVAGSPFGTGPHWFVTHHQMGNQGNKFSFDVDGLTGDPKAYHPDATSLTAFHGISVKTSPNRYDSSSIGFILGAQGQVLLIGNVNCVFSFTSCDTLFVEGRFSLFSPEQDVDKNGIPDSGQKPINCFPIQWNVTRLPLIPPCSPIPTLGDVWVTDDLQSSQDLVGSIDEDLVSERALVIQWYLDSQDAKEYHIYVSVDGGKYQYLGHTLDKTENLYEWKPGTRIYQNPAFNDGPQSGKSYSFEVFTVTASGNPLILGPYTSKGAVLFQEKQ